MNRRFTRGEPLGWLVRIIFLLAAGGLVGVLVLARRLEPDPRGFGTHTQLGFRPCSFLSSTGRLCPTCGMTTSFAWFARGRLDRSWQSNPAGSLYALFTGPLVAWLVVSAFANEPVGFASLSRPLSAVLFAVIILGLGSWFIRLMVSPGVVVRPEEDLPAIASQLGQ